ncbi:coatomer subunit beta' [Cimex lectularius]|uniref:Coatomer subunit beta' n=1 Tax=Cimex lectularius TaxID=79782 RepID=A0A8I6RQP3_CIMLE|nr:coatomer subunit beta' [Cimex lectularius]
MPLRLDIKRKLTARSERVKSVDLHPTEPWMLASLYSGNVHIWNHETQQMVRSFEVCDLPVRTAVFVPRKNWVVTGSDDMHVRVFNYNTLERMHSFEAHSDYVRWIVVHPTQPYILTCSDDMLIKLWNWEKSWHCQQVFEGHTHYVMQIVINPKDNNTFASASLDRTVKVWQLGSAAANFTLEGHEKGVNCVDYYHGGDKPYLISGADDHYVKIWDYQNKTCVQTLEGHELNITAVCFHTELPIVITGSEDGTVRLWHSSTYRLESSLNYGLERVWTISCLKGSNNIALGYDEGSIMVKIGREEPAISMDVNGEKIVWARHSEMQQVNLKSLGTESGEVKDGEKLPVVAKDMGPCEIFPQSIAHNPNGRFVVVCGDGEYIIYTSMALRNKSFGTAQEFVWAQESSDYAIREGTTTVRLYRQFKERTSFKPEFGAEGIFGGQLLGVRTVSGLSLYDWESLVLIRRIDIQAKALYWSEAGHLLAIVTDDSYFLLKYDPSVVNGSPPGPDGYDNAFELVKEVNESVKTGLWVGDCFIYTNAVCRINYYVGGEIVTVGHLDTTMYLLGYVARQNLLYLSDKHHNIVCYTLLLSVLEYQTAVMRRDFDTADRVLPTIPIQHRSRVAHFLEKQGFKKQALAVSTDPEHKFELALQLGDLEKAVALARDISSKSKWAQVAELATSQAKLGVAQMCLHQAQHYGGLLLLSTSASNVEMMEKLAESSGKDGKNNVSFLAYFLMGNLKMCLEILINTKRIPEAAFFARTYMPSQVPRVVELWKTLSKDKTGQSLAGPDQYPNLFPDWNDALKTEQYLKETRKTLHARDYSKVQPNHQRQPIEEMKAAEAAGQFTFNQIQSDKNELSQAVTDKPGEEESPKRPVEKKSHSEDDLDEVLDDVLNLEIEDMNLSDIDQNDSIDDDLYDA